MDKEKALDSIERAIEKSYTKHYDKIKKELAIHETYLHFLNIDFKIAGDMDGRDKIARQILKTEIIIETLEKLLIHYV